MTRDEREGVNANIADLGLYGALCYAKKRLVSEKDNRIRRLMIHQIRETARRLKVEIHAATRLARCHAQGLKQLAEAARVERAPNSRRGHRLAGEHDTKFRHASKKKGRYVVLW